MKYRTAVPHPEDEQAKRSGGRNVGEVVDLPRGVGCAPAERETGGGHQQWAIEFKQFVLLEDCIMYVYFVYMQGLARVVGHCTTREITHLSLESTVFLVREKRLQPWPQAQSSSSSIVLAPTCLMPVDSCNARKGEIVLHQRS